MFCLALRTARRPDSGRMCVLLEQMSYENTIYRRYGNMSQANFSRLYLGLSNRPGMGEGGVRQHDNHHHNPHADARVRDAEFAPAQRRLLVAKESLIEGVQLVILRKVIRFSPYVVGQGATRVLLAKLAVAMDLLSGLYM